MIDPISEELKHRLDVWSRLKGEGSTNSVAPQRLRELGVYGGAQGIWVDKARTQKLALDGSGVTVGLLHTGTSYSDDLSEDGVLYHYPNTGRAGGRDLSEIKSTKAAAQLALPVFVIGPGAASSTRSVHLAWIEDWDDRASIFLISFGEAKPQNARPAVEQESAFELTDKTSRRRANSYVRNGQQRFKFSVFKRCGPSCAVCGIGILPVLDAAHLCPKEKNGCNDPRNGLVFCAVHHRAFDASLFAINPETTEILFSSNGPSKEDLRIVKTSLAHLPQTPHREALQWRWMQRDEHKTHSD